MPENSISQEIDDIQRGPKLEPDEKESGNQLKHEERDTTDY